MSALNQRVVDAPNAIGSAPLESLCDTFFLFFGSWTLSWHIVYFTGGSFSTASLLGALVLLVTPLLFLFSIQKHTDTTHTAPRDKRIEVYLLLVFVLIAVMLTLGLKRPDADDGQYLGMAISLLANPGEAIQDVAGYDSGFWMSFRYAITSHDPLKAAISYLTGLSLLSSYYLVVPALCSAILVIINWRLLKLLAREELIFGFLFFFVVMIAWGDVHRTHANFGFVRLFQGKACFLSIAVPAIIFYYFKFSQDPRNKYYVVLLFFSLLSGVGFTPTGIVVGPLLLGLLVLSATNIKDIRHPGTLTLVIGGIILGVTLVISTKWYFGGMNIGVHIGGGMYVDSTTNWDMYKLVMGTGLRGLFLLACFAASFLFVLDKTIRPIYRNYVVAFLILLAIPWTSEILAKSLYSTLSWRWFWIVPFPVLAAVTVAGVVRESKALVGYPYTLALYLFLLVCFFAAAPRWVISEKNHAELTWPEHKLGQDSIFIRPLGKAAFVKDGKIYIEGSETGY